MSTNTISMEPKPIRNSSSLDNCDSSFFENKSRLSPRHGLDVYGFTERKMELQVVPSNCDESFESRDEEELLAFHPIVRNGSSLVCKPLLWRQDLKSAVSTTGPETGVPLTNQDTKPNGENSTKRKESDSDSLDVYLKPCVITPTKLEDLYSTLDDENDVFQFPTNSEAKQETQQLHDLSNNEQTSCLQPFHHLSELINFGCSIDDNNKLNSEDTVHHGNTLSMKESFDYFQSPMTYHDSHKTSNEIMSETNIGINCPLQYPNKRQPSFTRSEIVSTENLSLLFPPSISESPHERASVFAPKSKYEKSVLFRLENNCLSMKLDNQDTLDDHSKNFQYGKPNNDQQYVNIPSPAEPDVNCHSLSSDSNTSDERFKSRLSRFDTPRNLSSLNKLAISMDHEDKSLQNLKTVHNDTEKQRRDQMKSRFECLRKRIPKVERLQKAPKILILSKAWEYILHLQREEKKLEASKKAEKIKNRQLLEKLQMILR